MKLFNNNNKIEHIIAILFRHDEGQAFLLQVSEATKSAIIVDERAFKYTNGWDNLTYDIDELLFYVENDHKIELKKAVFFIYSHLVDAETREISATYKDALTKIVKDNDLEALGYLELDQVVSKYLEEKEQMPLSAIVVEIDTPAVSVFIYQAGELAFSESVARTESITSDLNEIFQHTSKDTTLPSRVVMYDSGGLQEESSEVLSFKWPKDLFVHIPKVEVLTEQDLKGVVMAAYKEQVLGATPQQALVEEAVTMPQEEASSDEVIDATESSEELGFVIGTDVKKSNLPEPVALPPQQFQEYTEPAVSMGAIAPTQSLFSKFKMPSFTMPKTFDKRFIIVSAIVILLFAGLFASLFYAHAANLVIFYEKQELKEEVDFENADFIEKKSEKIDVKTSIETTGTKKIGEKATGEVTIFNATEADKAFKKGTKLTSGGKSFILDSDITVKAATKTVTGNGDILTTTSKEKAKLTASDIGPTFNLAKDAEFTFDDASKTTYFAKANASFSGGTEEEIQTASKEDFVKIKKEVEKEINKKKTDSLKQANDAKKVLSELTEITMVKEDYSKEVAEEAKTLDADVTAEVTYYLYDDAPVKTALIEKLSDKVPNNYMLEENGITFKVVSSEKNDDDTINITIEATALPSYKVDASKLISQIKGKSTSFVEKTIKENGETQGFSLDIVSPVPFLKFFTPLFDRNFNITTEPLD